MEIQARQKFVCAEWRISIYGRSADEWAKLAKWFCTYKIKCQQVRWMIQVPRLYPLFRKLGKVKNFADMLRNIFQPLFQASLDPASHKDIFYMMQQMVGFDSVDDESQGTHSVLNSYPSPEEWDSETNPPYTYWMFHMYANIRSLNSLRRRMGLNTLTFRPHCGEAGNTSHLCSGFMLADGINHGVQLKESPVLQYLYYLAQIGIAVSPLSNDILFIPLDKSPFGTFFKRGAKCDVPVKHWALAVLRHNPSGPNSGPCRPNFAEIEKLGPNSSKFGPVSARLSPLLATPAPKPSSLQFHRVEPSFSRLFWPTLGRLQPCLADFD